MFNEPFFLLVNIEGTSHRVEGTPDSPLSEFINVAPFDMKDVGLDRSDMSLMDNAGVQLDCTHSPNRDRFKAGDIVYAYPDPWKIVKRLRRELKEARKCALLEAALVAETCTLGEVRDERFRITETLRHMAEKES